MKTRTTVTLVALVSRLFTSASADRNLEYIEKDGVAVSLVTPAMFLSDSVMEVNDIMNNSLVADTVCQHFYNATDFVQSEGIVIDCDHIGWLDEGDWLAYSIYLSSALNDTTSLNSTTTTLNDTSSSTYQLQLSVASPLGDGAMQIVDYDTEVTYATVNEFPSTVDWDTYHTVTVSLEINNITNNTIVLMIRSLEAGWTFRDFCVNHQTSPQVHVGTETLPSDTPSDMPSDIPSQVPSTRTSERTSETSSPVSVKTTTERQTETPSSMPSLNPSSAPAKHSNCTETTTVKHSPMPSLMPTQKSNYTERTTVKPSAMPSSAPVISKQSNSTETTTSVISMATSSPSSSPSCMPETEEPTSDREPGYKTNYYKEKSGKSRKRSCSERHGKSGKGGGKGGKGLEGLTSEKDYSSEGGKSGKGYNPGGNTIGRGSEEATSGKGYSSEGGKSGKGYNAEGNTTERGSEEAASEEGNNSEGVNSGNGHRLRRELQTKASPGQLLS